MKNKTNRQLSSKTYAGCGRNEGEDSADDDESDGNRPQDADDFFGRLPRILRFACPFDEKTAAKVFRELGCCKAITNGSMKLARSL
uniref:HDC02276 n=1 Tax=Drosophila melanogaster TaxID=7227 RepID=Q6IHK8_DROME|nr:TPA_inf: HDC02276 [Drosophila melanogaster]